LAVNYPAIDEKFDDITGIKVTAKPKEPLIIQYFLYWLSPHFGIKGTAEDNVKYFMESFNLFWER
jgi:hypothetical protein